jgi:Arc/MetJ family transcription regulator
MLRCMRTTIRIDDQLLAEAKAQAAQSGRTLNDIVEDALRESLARRSRSTREGPVELPTFSGSRLQPGVDLDDSSALVELMEGTDS